MTESVCGEPCFPAARRNYPIPCHAVSCVIRNIMTADLRGLIITQVKDPVPTLNSITIIVMIELYKIKEIAHRQYHMIIDVDHFSKLIPFIQEIGTSVWLLEKKSHQHSWESICEVIPSLGIKPECMIRNMSYECFFSNPAFLSLLLNWRGDLHVVLTNTVPPYFVDSSRGEDPSWYHLLQNKLDYRTEIYIPGT